MDANAAVSFVRVIELGSFRAAAARLGVPRSTVSRRVTALEHALGVRLIERTTRTLRLTDAGRAFLEEASPAVAGLDSAVRAAADGASRPSGLVRIAAPVGFGQFVLAEVLQRILRLHPHIKLAVELEDRVVDLVKDGFDLAIRTGSLPPSSLVARKVGETRVGLFASPRYLDRRGVPHKPEELLAHDALVMGTLERSAPWTFLVRRREVRVDVAARAVVNHFVVLRSFCVDGHGIARLPRFLAEPMLQNGQLVSLLDAFEQPPVRVQLVWPQGRRLPARTRVVIDMLIETLPKLIL